MSEQPSGPENTYTVYPPGSTPLLGIISESEAKEAADKVLGSQVRAPGGGIIYTSKAPEN